MKRIIYIIKSLKHSFQFRLFLVNVLIIFIFIPAIGYFSYLQGKKTIENQIKQYSINTSNQIVERVRSFLAPVTSNVKLMKAFFENGLLNPENQKDLILYLHLLQRDHPEFLNINFGDEYGNFTMVPPQRPEVHALFDPRIRPWYVGAKKNLNLFWTDVYLFASSQNPGITASIPILDSYQKMLGVCSIDIDLSTLSRFLKSIKIGKHGYAFIIENNQGRVIAHPELLGLHFNPDQVRFLSACLSNLIKEGKRFGTTGYMGNRFFTAYTNYPENNWIVGVTLPVTDFLEDINNIKKVTVTMVLAAILLSSALSYLLALTIVKPLKRLEKGIKRVSAGNLDYKVDIADPDIVGSLSDAFNQMASSLKKSREEIKKTYFELAEKEKMAALGQLTAGIAHEIKNPLGIILGSAEVAANRKRPLAMREEAASFIIDEIIRLNNTLTAFLDFARPVMPNFIETDLTQLIEKTLELCEEQMGQQGIKMVRNLMKDLPVCMADHDQMRQVFLNLLINAKQAMPNGGTLTIKTFPGEKSDGCSQVDIEGNVISQSLHDNQIVISISDTGIGISDDCLEKIFEPFVTFKDDGTGLGLSIVYQILKLHRATISVESEIGKGTMFTIFYPGLSSWINNET